MFLRILRISLYTCYFACLLYSTILGVTELGFMGASGVYGVYIGYLRGFRDSKVDEGAQEFYSYLPVTGDIGKELRTSALSILHEVLDKGTHPETKYESFVFSRMERGELNREFSSEAAVSSHRLPRSSVGSLSCFALLRLSFSHEVYSLSRDLYRYDHLKHSPGGNETPEWFAFKVHTYSKGFSVLSVASVFVSELSQDGHTGVDGGCLVVAFSDAAAVRSNAITHSFGDSPDVKVAYNMRFIYVGPSTGSPSRRSESENSKTSETSSETSDSYALVAFTSLVGDTPKVVPVGLPSELRKSAVIAAHESHTSQLIKLLADPKLEALKATALESGYPPNLDLEADHDAFVRRTKQTILAQRVAWASFARERQGAKPVSRHVGP